MGKVGIEMPAAVLVADFLFGVKVGFQVASVPHRLLPNDTILHHQKFSAFCAADNYQLGWAVNMCLRRNGVDTAAPDPMALDSPELNMNVESTAVQFQLSAQYSHDATVSSDMIPEAAH